MNYKKIILFLGVSILLVAITFLVSLTIGSKNNTITDVYNTLVLKDNTNFINSVIIQRIPRTFYGFIAGAALAVSGVLMQSLTRNPIADPSILGVNSGASLFVVFGIAFLDINTPIEYIMLALIGGFLIVFIVYGIACFGGNPTPIKLALSGAAVSMTCSSLISMIMLPNSTVMNEFRFWQVGSIGGADMVNLYYSLPFIIVALIASFSLIPSLNALMLGDDVAVGLGVNIVLVRIMCSVIGVILCATVTSVCGPISFIGLMVPHIIRMIFGSDMKILMPYSLVTGGILLLICDVLGRWLGSPSEIQVGIITAILGAPVFVFIARKAKVQSL